MAELLLLVGWVLELVHVCVTWARKAILALSYTQMEVTSLAGSRISDMRRCCSQQGTD
jgi:hypothetical protein